MIAFWQFTILGLVFGAVYAVTASGLVVTYATTGVFNFAHGAVGMVAAFTYWELTQGHGVPVVVALVLVLLVEAPVVGLVVERVLMRRLHGASAERSLMVTLGLLLVLLGISLQVWGGQTARTLPPFFAADSITVLHVTFPVHYLVVVLVTVAVAVGLGALLRTTRTGVAMRAVVDDPDLLAMAGASPLRIARSGWVLGAVLAALAGVLIAPLEGQLDQTTLTLFVVNGFAAAVIGRLRNLPATFAGALAIGLGEQYVNAYVPSGFATNWLPNANLALPMVFLFAALLLLPQDRLRAAGHTAVSRLAAVPDLRRSLAGAGGVVVLAVLAAVGLSTTWQFTVAQGLIFGVAALSLVLLTGYAGQVSLGQFAFAGIGAFAMGKVAGGGSWLGVLVAVLVAAAVGAIVALPTVRVRGLYLALATLAFAQFAASIFFSNQHIFTHSGSIIVHRLALPGIDFASTRAELVLCGVAFAVCSTVVLTLRRGVFGRRLVALRDSPAACSTVGLDVRVTRLVVFAVAAGMAGLAGALYGTLQGPVGANDFPLLVSLELLLMLVIWGVRSTGGALLAGLSFAVVLGHASNTVGLLLGVGIIAIGWLPDGLLGSAAPLLAGLARASAPGGRPGSAPTDAGGRAARPGTARPAAVLARLTGGRGNGEPHVA